MRNLLIVLGMAFMFSCTCDKTCKAPWKNLLQGDYLDGWHQVGGEAKYSVEDGVITGKTVLETPNSFLVTDSVYKDFILTFEVKVHEKLNSGVQIRSHSIPEYKDGRFHGYQVEIEQPERDRNWSGGIYDEARRGWIYKLEDNEAGRKAFKDEDWNKYRIEAIGDTIKTWINGVPCAYLIDNMTSSGYIGLQVHSVGSDTAKEGIWVKWRNLCILTDSQEIRKHSKKSPLKPEKNLFNVLTEEQKEEGWKLLFDGKTTEGWRGAYMEYFPRKGWQVFNGMLTVLESGGEEAQYGGDIVTVDEYEDFELQLDFRLTEGANSGIKYYVTEKEKGNPGSAFGLEYQLLDDENHPDAKKGRNGNRTLASLYDMIPADSLKKVNPPREWNHIRLVSKDGHVEYYLNGKKTLEFDRGSERFRELVEKSKYSAPKYNTHGRFGEAEKGHILLQDHGNTVSFRNIMIRKL